MLARRGAFLPRDTTSLSAPWLPLGPGSVVSSIYGNLTGRITALALDPNDPTGNTLYLGSTGGGVWKSTSAAGLAAAASFTPLTDTLPVFSPDAGSAVIPSLSIGALAVQPTVNPVVLAGTGDPNDATDSLYGEGILRSADGGLTWTLAASSHDGANGIHSFAGLATAGLAFSTGTPSLVVAAFSTSPQSAIVDATNTASVPGLYVSTDAGVTWQMATVYDGSTVVQQPQPLGTGQTGNSATAVVWDAQRGRFFAALRSHGYYSSPDGLTWTRLSNQPGTGLSSSKCPVGSTGQGSPTCPIFRGALAVQPATGDLYALTVDAQNNDGGLWQDLCVETNSGGCVNAAPVWGARLDNGALESGSGSTLIEQGGYDLTLAAVPTGSGASAGTLLFAGTVDLYRCALSPGDSSCTLRNTTNALNGCAAPAGVAPAQHALAAMLPASGSPLLLLGNDGGLWRSLDGVNQTDPPCSASDATHFDNLNAQLGAGGSLAEITGFADDPASAGTLLAGLGANGSAATTTAAPEMTGAWPQLSAGEGGYPLLDSNDPANWYFAVGAGVDLKACTAGSSCTAEDLLPPATIGSTQVGGDASLLDAPTLLDPQTTANLLVGTCRVWRGPAADGALWSAANAISPAFNGSATPCTASDPLVRSLAAGGPAATSANPQNSGSTVLYAGIAGLLDGGGNLPGHLFVTTAAGTANGTAAWTDASLGTVTNDPADSGVFNPAGFDVSSVTIDPHDPTGATVYAAIQGFSTLDSNSPHLYRSTDFGAHWLNLSANLPNAPANAVVVDPNDANTVYVAMDTGVYVTQGVSTCAAQNCWSVLGTSLPNSPVVALTAEPGLPTGDGRRGLLRVATYGRGLWEIPLVTAISLAQPQITLSATSLNFSPQQVGTQSSTQTVTVTSSGNAPVTFKTSALAGDFALAAETCSGQTLPVNATCRVSLVFAPTVTGNRTGLLTLYADVPAGQATVALTGIGTAPAAVVLTPLSLTFPATVVNQPATAQIITVANTGGNPATLQPPSITGDFAIAANTCGTTLSSQTACSISIGFTPTASGNRVGTLTVSDSAGMQTAQLSGIGEAPATDTLTPTALSFGSQTVGSSSSAQTVTLTNSGDVALTLITAAVSAGDFTAVNGCGPSLAAHSSCAVSVSFVPTATGNRAATLTVTDQFRSQAVSLTGSGVAPAGVSLSPAALSFNPTGVGLLSPAQTVTLTNNGGQPLTLSSIAASPGFTIAASTCVLSAPLAAGSSCALTLLFAPVAAGPLTGTLTLTDNAASGNPSGTQIATLSGTGIDFALTANGATAVTVKSGGSAVFPLLLSSLAGLPGDVALNCSGAPVNSTCNITPSTAPLGGTYTVSVTVQTGVSTAQVTPPALPGHPRDEREAQRLAENLLLAFALPVAFAARRRRGRNHKRQGLSFLLLAVLVCGLGAVTGCGSGRTIPPSTVPTSPIGPVDPTPVGTYPIQVSASAAGLTHTVALTLTVQ